MLPTNPEIRARFLSTAQSQAGAWLMAFPRLKSTKMTNMEFSTAFLLRVGIHPPWVDPHRKCTACNSGTVIGMHCQHWFTCKHNGTLIHRHDAVVDEITKLMNHARLRELPVHQAFPFATDKQIRADIRLLSPKIPGLYSEGESASANVNLDIRITHPCTETNIKKNNSHIYQGNSAKAAYNDKMGKFYKVATVHGEIFKPVIFETFGYWHKEVKDIVRAVCSHITSKIQPSVAQSVMVSYWTRRLSVAIARSVSQSLISKAEECYIRRSHEDEEDLSTTMILNHRASVLV